jgi:hypothetical protein
LWLALQQPLPYPRIRILSLLVHRRQAESCYSEGEEEPRSVETEELALRLGELWLCPLNSGEVVISDI